MVSFITEMAAISKKTVEDTHSVKLEKNHCLMNITHKNDKSVYNSSGNTISTSEEDLVTEFDSVL